MKNVTAKITRMITRELHTEILNLYRRTPPWRELDKSLSIFSRRSTRECEISVFFSFFSRQAELHGLILKSGRVTERKVEAKSVKQGR